MNITGWVISPKYKGLKRLDVSGISYYTNLAVGAIKILFNFFRQCLDIDVRFLLW